MAESFLSTLLLMFISSRYFIHDARRNTESNIVIQMTLEHAPVQRLKKKEMDQKNNFQQRHVNVSLISSFHIVNLFVRITLVIQYSLQKSLSQGGFPAL